MGNGNIQYSGEKDCVQEGDDRAHQIILLKWNGGDGDINGIFHIFDLKYLIVCIRIFRI
jgi:hypothetical protein